MHLENEFSLNVLVHVSFIIQSATQIIRVKCNNNNSVCFSSNDQTLLITTLHEHNVGIPENQISLLINSQRHSFVYVIYKILRTKRIKSQRPSNIRSHMANFNKKVASRVFK